MYVKWALQLRLDQVTEARFDWRLLTGDPEVPDHGQDVMALKALSVGNATSPAPSVVGRRRWSENLADQSAAAPASATA
jgi:hypothetical protein